MIECWAPFPSIFDCNHSLLVLLVEFLCGNHLARTKNAVLFFLCFCFAFLCTQKKENKRHVLAVWEFFVHRKRISKRFGRHSTKKWVPLTARQKKNKSQRRTIKLNKKNALLFLFFFFSFFYFVGRKKIRTQPTTVFFDTI